MRLLFEDMIRAETKKYVCRIWKRYCTPSLELSNEELKQRVIDKLNHDFPFKKDMAEDIARYRGVSAVEIVDRRTGDGVCVYRDWP
jgi:hypothetical protein